jgi:hypothetical protein
MGQLVADNMRSKLMQVNDIIQTSENLGATPVLDAPTSWQYLVWKYEYNASRNLIGSASTDHLVITRALQAAGDDGTLRILRASPNVLIDLRRKGVMDDVRAMLRSGIRDIALASPADVEGVTIDIAATLSSAFQQHQRKLDDLIESGVRWYGAKLAPMVVSACMSILGAATGNIPLATAGAISTALGAPTAKDVARDAKTLIAGYKHLWHSAAGILFRNA